MDNNYTYIKSILDLKTNESIGNELAERQFQVIAKSYEYLSKSENNIIYIADEVGLGKTYIGIGIALLIRHFSKDVTNHKDLIIVPKKNLQYKWRKELNNFLKYNYKTNNDFIWNQFESSDCIKERLSYIKKTDPISIFRMTSFSTVASSRNSKKDLKEYLIEQVFKGNEFASLIIESAWNKGYFNKEYASYLRKIVACILNAISPKIDCAIIDEAHNYKHGLREDGDDTSIRNEVTSRFLGSIIDNKIMNEFPSLKGKMKFPLAKKVICLSATPKDRNLIEIKNQFNCFTNKHILSDVITSEEVKSKLKMFLIRGNMEYVIKSETVSRNQCRFEHRHGNINKDMNAVKLELKDNFESIFWQLLQYNSIKHLNSKNNPSFEIGMLAGFESYQLDTEKKKQENIDEDEKKIEDKEYEITVSRNNKISEDYNVVKQLVDSYRDEFNNEYPPHPKQSRLEIEVVGQMSKQEKSLIFVRRVATAYEIEKRIQFRFEKDFVNDYVLNFLGRYKKFNSQSVKEIKDAFNKRHILEKTPDLFNALLKRSEIKDYLSQKLNNDPENIVKHSMIWLETAIYNSEFYNAVEDFIVNKKKNISGDFKEITIKALKGSYLEFMSKFDEMEDDEIDDDEIDDDNRYFFTNYFKKGNQGFRYRTKLNRENWYDINLLKLNNKFNFLNVDEDAILNETKFIQINKKKKKNKVFLERENIVYNHLYNSSFNFLRTPESKKESKNLNDTTFITELLIQCCHGEFEKWITKRITESDVKKCLDDIVLLNMIIKNIFRYGSGLLAGFVADSYSGERYITNALIELLAEDDAPFHFVLNEIKTIINDFDLIVSINFQDKNRIDTIMKNMSPIVGATGQDKRDRGMLASQFRMPGYPYVLVTTDIFREGEDLHTYCQNVYHYGIAWNPSDMEQRTGRIDRINSLSYRKLNKTNEVNFDNKIQVFYPYLSQSVEVNQVVELLKNVDKFIETFNEIEIENKYESSVKLDKEIVESDIPQQITSKIHSLYDVWDFEV